MTEPTSSALSMIGDPLCPRVRMGGRHMTSSQNERTTLRPSLDYMAGGRWLKT
ncbi:unnamed protein product [Staurois parvus]|uniref:Uncharacterized protein n=1 Tax=Staurois parvus TaxID=386267 RepID=A0ABN9DHV9_9NEOB|nr:unnamed protein product [Staurois parvus]